MEKLILIHQITQGDTNIPSIVSNKRVNCSIPSRKIRCSFGKNSRKFARTSRFSRPFWDLRRPSTPATRLFGISASYPKVMSIDRLI